MARRLTALDAIPLTWGALDLIQIAHLWTPFSVWLRASGTIVAGRGGPGTVIPVTIVLSAVTYLTLPVSAVMLLSRWRYAAVLCLAQAPLRVAFMMPSVPGVTWLAQLFPALSFAPAGIAVLSLVELFKLATLALWFARSFEARARRA